MQKYLTILYAFISVSLSGQDFTIIEIPDTQYETADTYGNPKMFYAQTEWIAKSKDSLNIVFVTHVGDITQNNYEIQWQRADTAMSTLDDAGVPYSLTTGNHDGLTNTLFDYYFGEDRFKAYSYYGGHFAASNQNNYELFEASGMKFVIIHLQYACSSIPNTILWADGILKAYPGRRAILTSHDIIDENGEFSYEGQKIYDELKDNPNLFLMVCGHYHGQSKRSDKYNGNTIHTVMGNYQSINGGGGWTRIMRFSPKNDSIYISTYSPFAEQEWPSDTLNYFSLYYDMDDQDAKGLISNHVFYVQDKAYNPKASDSNPGNDIEYPWATWQHAFDQAKRGDTIYFRGGVWYPDSRVLVGSYGHPTKIGTYDSLICFLNYPGETPILDGSKFSTTGGHDNGLNITDSKYFKLKGLTIRNVKQKVADQYVVGLEMVNTTGGSVWIENLTVHGIWGDGFNFSTWDTIYVKNCDAYNNADSISYEQGVGNRADGFSGGSGGEAVDTFKVIYYEGCRSWHNSDDGFDMGTSKQFQIKNCWSFLNGYLPEGGGVGFKTGPSHVFTPNKRRIFNTLAAFNKYPGYADQNMSDPYYGPVVEYSNNTSFKNRIGFISDNSNFNCNTGYSNVVYNNNLVYQSSMSYYDQMYLTLCHSAPPYYPHYAKFNNNTWSYKETAPYWEYNPDVKVTDEDFISVDSTFAIAHLTAPRKADGSLPDLTFLKLQESSDLIDAGLDVGFPFYGSAPDIGYSEYNSGPVTTSPPIFISGVIENTSPSKLEMTYNLTLANIIPASSAFTVKVNSTIRTVSSVTIIGTNVVLTLTSPVVYGDFVTVAYTQPLTNPLQTIAGGQAISILAQNITNNIAAQIPIYISSVIENGSPSILEMGYSLSLTNIVPATSSFAVKVNSVTRTVTTVSISGTKVLLTLTSPVVYGDVVTIAYTKPATNPVQTPAGMQANSITPQSVINNCSPVANQTPYITITSPTKSLTFVAPTTITIEASASDPDGAVTKVEFYNSDTKLGEKTAPPYNITWKNVYEGTYPIYAIATDNAGAKTVSETVTIIVEKSAAIVNKLPIVNLKYSSHGNIVNPKKHDNILLTAEAYDLDGNITNVEFKSGNTSLAIVYTAPYEYTIQNIDTGTYIVTAIATDNRGASTASTPIEIYVADISENSAMINLSPNPNNGQFAIDIYSEIPGLKKKISIINLSGNTIYEDKLEDLENHKEFDLSTAASGVHIIMISSDNKIISTKKFIKK